MPREANSWSSTSRALDTPYPSRTHFLANIDERVEELPCSWLPTAVPLRLSNEAAGL